MSIYTKPRNPTLLRRTSRDAILISTAILLTLFITSLFHPPSPLPPHTALIRRRPLEHPSLNATSRTDTPPEANLAYFIQIAQSTAPHLPRLLARLHHPANVYAIHFDSKMEPAIVTNVTQQLHNTNPAYIHNVHIMPSELITYRGISMVLNTINAMKFLLEHHSHWHYFINLSGSDYPLTSPHLQRQLLGRHIINPLNFISFAAHDRWRDNVAFRIDHFYVDDALSFTTGPSEVRQMPQLNPLARRTTLELASAEAWMINSRDFCRFVVTDGYARKLLLAFAYSIEPSEHYFATLLWNHPRYNRTIVRRALRHVIWKHEGEEAGQHPFLVDETLPDGTFKFQQLVRDSPNFFIRKFKHAESPLMDYIDERRDDEDHVREVHKLFNWATETALAQDK